MHRPFLKWSCRLLTNTITFPPLQSVNPDGWTVSVSFLPDASDQVLRRRHRDHIAQPGVHRRPVHGEVARAGWTVLHTRVIFKKHSFITTVTKDGPWCIYVCMFVEGPRKLPWSRRVWRSPHQPLQTWTTQLLRYCYCHPVVSKGDQRCCVRCSGGCQW